MLTADGEPRVSLPYCGLGDWQGTGELTRRGLFEKIFTGGRNIGEAIFGGRPVRPLSVAVVASSLFAFTDKQLCAQAALNPGALPHLHDQLHLAEQRIRCGDPDVHGRAQRGVWPYGYLLDTRQPQSIHGPGKSRPLALCLLPSLYRATDLEEYRDFTHNKYCLDDTDPNGNYANDFMVDPKYKKGGADQLNVFLVEQITNVPDKGGGTNGEWRMVAEVAVCRGLC